MYTHTDEAWLVASGTLPDVIPRIPRASSHKAKQYKNLTIDKIKVLIRSIRKEADVLARTGTDLAGDMTETAASVNRITANIRGIKSQTDKQAAGVSSSHAVMEEVVAGIETLNAHIQKQTERVSQSSRAVEEMLANIQSVTRTLAA
ncbi:MAG: methyl-accepting chemotaxis protein, partial [Treponema sp.]|nr:methyl-accepting chemotaxis protein [Treponema sp.]